MCEGDWNVISLKLFYINIFDVGYNKIKWKYKVTIFEAKIGQKNAYIKTERLKFDRFVLFAIFVRWETLKKSNQSILTVIFVFI